MKTYKVKYGQNIFDVATTLYGSVEGVYGLLIANPELSISTDLEEGDELLYQEGWSINPSIVAYFSDKNTYPANGTCKEITVDEPLGLPFMMAIIDPMCPRFYMDLEGSGTVQVDWGDGKKYETFQFYAGALSISHWYPEVSARRTIRFYGSPDITRMYIKTGEGELRLLKSLTLNRYENSSRLSDIQARNLITLA